MRFAIGLTFAFALLARPHIRAQTAAPEAKSVLERTLASYAVPKSYQGAWTYALQRGESRREMAIEIKSKGIRRLSFRVTAVPGAKPAPDIDSIPEMLVVVDGETAWFQNTTDRSYFKVRVPPETRLTPLMFLPMIPAASEVKRGPDETIDGRKTLVVQAETTDGGTTKMLVDAETFRIRKVTSEKVVANIKVSSTLQVVKETFDGDIADSVFAYRPPRGIKEMPPPPGAAQLFGGK